MTTMDFRTTQPTPTVTPAMYRTRAKALIAKGGDWSPAMDLVLLEALGRGEKLAGAAAAIGVPMQAARERFFTIQRAMTSREYLPQDAQQALLSVLREAVGRVQ